jgi:hypothetical protein
MIAKLKIPTRSQMKGEERAAYFTWLCTKIYPKKSYHFLLKTLHRREFYWTVPNDDNRAEDGKKLREEYQRDTAYILDYEALDGPCSVLEMLVALAERWEGITGCSPDENQSYVWFWLMMENCGLAGYTDARITAPNAAFEVDQIIDQVLGRTYRRNGRGGLFPLRRPKEDQRRVELWYQLNAYLLENERLTDSGIV